MDKNTVKNAMVQQQNQNKSVAVKQNAATMLDFFKKNESHIRMALPRHMTPERLIRMSVTAMSRNPKLFECALPQLFGAVVQASQLGLEPDVNGQCYLVPFKNNKNGGAMECQLMIGYRGYNELAWRSGLVASIHADMVCENDMFEFEYGKEEKFRHKPAEGERGAIKYFYAYFHTKTGGFNFTVLSRSAVDAIRATAKTDNIWSAHYEEMGKKTAIRRLAKMMPLSAELNRAIELDDAATTGKPQGLDIGNLTNGQFEPVIEPDQPDQQPEEQKPEADGAPDIAEDNKSASQPPEESDAVYKKLTSEILACKSVEELKRHSEVNGTAISWLPEDDQKKISGHYKTMMQALSKKGK